MKTTNSLRVRASRFFSNRYAYRERPDYLVALVAFGIIVITTALSLANAMTTTLQCTRTQREDRREVREIQSEQFGPSSGARLRPIPKEIALKSNVGICQKHCQTLDQR